MARKRPIVVVSSAARTTTGNSGALSVTDNGGTLALLLAVTAHAGTTPTMTVSVEWSTDGTTFFQGDPADAFSGLTTTDKNMAKSFTVKAPFYRIVWTLGGTSPSYTFSVSAYIPS